MRSLLVVALVLGMTAVYSTNSIIPEYYVDKAPKGEYRTYDSRQIVVPKYIMKPDASGKGYRVYEAGKAVLPVYRVEKRKPRQWLHSEKSK